MKKTYETELPEGYKKVYSINLKDKQTGIFHFVLSLIPITVLTPIIYLLNYSWVVEDFFRLFDFLLILTFFRSWCLFGLIFCGLHFLFEGIACRIIHHKKATLLVNHNTLSHGIHNVYIHKKAMLFEILIPHIIFAIIYLAAIIYLLTLTSFLLFAPLFTLSMHINICVGDLHMLYALLIKCKGKNALCFNNGVVISFYTKSQENCQITAL